MTFVRDYFLSGMTFCQGLLFVRDDFLSGITFCQELLFVRDYFLSGITFCQGQLLSGITFCQGLLFVRNYFLSGTTFVRDYCQGLLLSGTPKRFHLPGTATFLCVVADLFLAVLPLSFSLLYFPSFLLSFRFALKQHNHTHFKRTIWTTWTIWTTRSSWTQQTSWVTARFQWAAKQS